MIGTIVWILGSARSGRRGKKQGTVENADGTKRMVQLAVPGVSPCHLLLSWIVDLSVHSAIRNLQHTCMR